MTNVKISREIRESSLMQDAFGGGSTFSRARTETKVVNINELRDYLNVTPGGEDSGDNFGSRSVRYSEWRVDGVENEKVKLPKDVAEAIEYIRSKGFGNHSLVNREFIAGMFPESVYAPINKYCGKHFDDYLMAIANGFEIEEKSPEEIEAERCEKVREYFEEYRIKALKTRPGYEQIKAEIHYEAIQQTLDLLGKRIEGVNY
jgi:hypothetical protein